MLSRRVFMKNGGLALLSLGFAPAFLSRTVEAATAIDPALECQAWAPCRPRVTTTRATPCPRRDRALAAKSLSP